MIRRPPRSTRTDTSFPTRRSSDLPCRLVIRWAGENTFGAFAPDALNSHQEYRVIKEGLRCIPFLDGPLLLFSEDEVFFHVAPLAIRSEEHTSELQSLMRLSYAVFCLTKKINTHTTIPYITIPPSIHTASN